MSKRVILAGGSGFLGQSLSAHLDALSYDSIVLSRSSRKRSGYAHWDGATLGDWTDHLEGAAAIINLTGRSVDCRYTAANRREIIESRVHSVRALGDAVRQCSSPPPSWIQAASLAIYGDAGEAICHDDAPHGSGFSVEVCEQWEGELKNQQLPKTRTTVLRIGFALAANGAHWGVLQRLHGLALAEGWATVASTSVGFTSTT